MDARSVSENAEGRQILLDKVAESRSRGDRDSAARHLIDLAYLVKQIGPITEKPWIQEYMEYVDEAHKLLAGSRNKQLLAYAHRAVNLAFAVQPEVAIRHLEIALKLSEECADIEGQGSALYELGVLARRFDPIGAEAYLKRAEAAFEKADSAYGVGLVYMNRGVFGANRTKRERADLLIGAADRFAKSGDPKAALRALRQALVFGAEALQDEEIEAVGEWMARLCQRSKSVRDEALVYRHLKQVFADRGKHALQARYAELEDGLDVRAHGSRLGRLEFDLECIDEALPSTQGRDLKKTMKARRAELLLEIASERERAKV